MTKPGAPAEAARLMEEAGVSYAIIGGHAVNAWLEPRFTADIDITIAANADDLARLNDVFAKANYSLVRQFGQELPSGPDFIRWASKNGDVVELQVAKTELQRTVVRRAVVSDAGARVATPEDLLVLKLIAYRPKDRIDLEGLAVLDKIDWAYVEEWAREWDLLDRLARIRR